MAFRGLVLLMLCAVHLGAFNLGDYYFERGYYFESVTEYKRLLFSGSKDSTDRWLLQIGRACRLGGRSDDAEEPLLKAIGNSDTTEFDLPALLLLAEIHWENYNYSAVRHILDNLGQFDAQADADRVAYIKAWSYFYEANWQAGQAILRDSNYPAKQALITAIDHVPSLPQKSKRKALYMSLILPGSGQVYSGDWKNAAFSGALVGSLMVSIVNNIIQQAYIIAAVKYAFLYTRYASGGLRHVAHAIERQNVDVIGEYLKSLHSIHPDPFPLLKQLARPQPTLSVRD